MNNEINRSPYYQKFYWTSLDTIGNNLEQLHDGHPIGLHYASLNSAMTENSGDGTIIFRCD